MREAQCPPHMYCRKPSVVEDGGGERARASHAGMQQASDWLLARVTSEMGKAERGGNTATPGGSQHPSSERLLWSLDTGTRATCSSNGSGGEEDEAEAVDREREATRSSTPHSGDGMSHCGGREQEVSVEIGETYLCQRADKTWRKLKYLFRIVFQKHSLPFYS